MLSKIKLILLVFLNNSYCFHNPFTTISSPPTGQLRVIEPYKKSLSNKNILFFPAYFKKSFPSELYNSFLYNLASESTIYIPDDDDDKCNNLISILQKQNDPLIIIAHSSGSMKAIENCQLNNQIKYLVLLDPIEFQNVRLFHNQKPKQINLKNIKKMIIINSKKSSQWKFLPTIPPINTLKISDSRIILPNSSFFKIFDTNFGHLDILDSTWSDISHKTFTRGVDDRNPMLLQRYHYYMSKIILNIFNNKNIDFNNMIDYITKNNLDILKDKTIIDNFVSVCENDNIQLLPPNKTQNSKFIDLENINDYDDDIWLDITLD